MFLFLSYHTAFKPYSLWCLWLLYLLPPCCSPVQSCSLFRLQQAATTFGHRALVLFCLCPTSSPSLFPSVFQSHVPRIRISIKSFDVPQARASFFSLQPPAHFCIVDEPRDLYLCCGPKQYTQVYEVSPFANRNLFRAQFPQHATSLPSSIPAVEQEVRDGLFLRATPPALGILDLAYSKQVSSSDRVSGPELQISSCNRLSCACNVLVGLCYGLPLFLDSLLHVRKRG